VGDVARWQEDGRGGMTVASDARAVGTLAARCRVNLSGRPVKLEIDHLYVSFVPKGSSATGSGLVIEMGECKLEFLRIAGEDWIEARQRSCTGTGERDVTVRFIDNSEKDPVRVDLRGLRVTAADAPEQSPGQSAPLMNN
jgi:hypothetical protein